ncbi:MAG: hypothetical protein K2X29_10370, partial [Candidatus Obscuribacterales bacterium]|nr:hypothetical protein [Candidatus Obscuribacterales bacterium]
PRQRPGIWRCLMNNDRLIDPFQVELIREEIRYSPVNATAEALELIALFDFQQSLLSQWYRSNQ